jgi:hypothetical protein
MHNADYLLRDYKQKAAEYTALCERANAAKQADHDGPRLGLWEDLARNDEMLRKNLWFLGDALRCARQGNWPGVEFTLPQFLQVERNRLRQKLMIMERSQIEYYSGAREIKREENLLWNELGSLMRGFLEIGEARERALVESVNTACGGEEYRSAHFYLTIFRQNARIVLHTYKWWSGQA